MVIDRYFRRQAAASVLGVLAVLLLVWVSHRFVRYLAQAAAGKIAADLILELLGLKLVANLNLLLPPALFLGVLLALGRLHRDNEVVALQSAGVSPGRFLRASLRLSAGFAVVAAVVSLGLGPAAARLADEVERRAEETADFAGIFAGRFKALEGGDRVLYAQGVGDGGRSLVQVFAQARLGGRLYTFSAARAYQRRDPDSGDRFMVLVDGHRYEGEPGALDFVVSRYREHAVRIEAGGSGGPSTRLQGVSTAELLGPWDRKRRAELHWRIGVPVSVLILGALAVPLARTSPRQGRYGALFTAVLVYFLYSNLLGIGRELIEQGRLPASIGLWPVHGVLLLFAGGLVALHTVPTGYLRSRLRRFWGFGTGGRTAP
jgi:lipopolysaccharide export system permease protein